MGANVVDVHQEHFTADEAYADFTRLDTSSESVEETVKRVLEIMR